MNSRLQMLSPVLAHEPLPRAQALGRVGLFQLVHTVSANVASPRAVAFTPAADASGTLRLQRVVLSKELRLRELAAGCVGGALVVPIVTITKIFKMVDLLRLEKHREGDRMHGCVSPLIRTCRGQHGSPSADNPFQRSRWNLPARYRTCQCYPDT
jgi:hypothetical protein